MGWMILVGSLLSEVPLYENDLVTSIETHSTVVWWKLKTSFTHIDT